MGAAGTKEATASKKDAATTSKGTLKSLDVTRRVDEIAARYITRSRFRDLKHLDDPQYCNELVVLTSDALGSQLDGLDIGSLDKRQESGPGRVEFSTRRRLADPSRVKGVSGQKKRLACERIAEHYVKIAHVFAAIQSAVGGTTYNSATGRSEAVGRPPCAARLKALAPEEKEGRMLITPDGICNLNRETAGGKPAILRDEFGRSFTSFSALYNDEYVPGPVDVASGRAMPGQWKRSPEMQELYQRDVTAFYKAFTGTDPPESDGKSVITSFEAIPLDDYRKSASCARPEELADLEKVCTSIRSVARIRREIAEKKRVLDQSSDEAQDRARKDLEVLERELVDAERTSVSPEDQEDAAYLRCTRNSKCKWLLPEPGQPGQCVAAKGAGAYRGTVEGPKTDKLFEKYGAHYRKMLQRSNKAKDSLNTVLDQLFTTHDEEGDAVPVITVNPSLTRANLKEVIGKTRDILASMYIDCEKDFREGMAILDEIIKDRGSSLKAMRVESLDRAEAQAYAQPYHAASPRPGDRYDEYSSYAQERERRRQEAERQQRIYKMGALMEGMGAHRYPYGDPRTAHLGYEGYR